MKIFNTKTNGDNNNNNFEGGIIMRNRTMNTMDTFAGTIRTALAEQLGEGFKVDVVTVTKNNAVKFTGVTIKEAVSTISPVIYLDQSYADYLKGRPVSDIIDRILFIYERNRVAESFNAGFIGDYSQVKSRICFKLIGADRNRELLDNTPHILFNDLAIVFFVLVGNEKGSTATITVTESLAGTWGADAQQLYDMALQNTPHLMRGQVRTMGSVLAEIMDVHTPDEFFDMTGVEEDMPLYVASNTDKVNGAAVILYPGLLKAFAEKTGKSFYILPSSIHECLFVPEGSDNDADILRNMVREVNATQVAPAEVLSDNIYRYDRDTDCVTIA